MSNVSKYVFGKNKLGRMKRTVECDENTYDDVSWIPNFKGSQRGAVLKTTNEYLLAHGMRKRSQIDSINGNDISNLPYKRIMKLLNEFISSQQPFITSFMIPEQDVDTVEVFFRGKFCNDYIGFSCDENNNNFIVSSIDYNNKEAQLFTQKSNIKPGYRVIKVKGLKVINKKYHDILKQIITASNDTRIDYAIIFEQGDINWYNLKTPSSSKSSSHLKHAKSVNNIALNKRRKSGNMLPKTSSRSSLKATSKSSHVKKTKSFDFGKKNLSKDLHSPKSNKNDDLLISPVPFRKNSSNKSGKRSPLSKSPKSSNKSGKRSPISPLSTKSPSSSRSSMTPTSNQLQIGKISFGTCKLGLTRRVIQCDSDTFVDCDFVPNFKGSQRGAVMKKTNEFLLNRGLIKKTQIDAINDHDVSSASYHAIIHALNEYITAEEEFDVAFMIPAQTVKTVEIFFRGSFLEYMDFIADENGNNCIIKNIKSNTDFGKTFMGKCKLSVGYRITKIKTSKVVNKKYQSIIKMLEQSGKDMRVQYLVVFEQGKLGWYGYQEGGDVMDDKPEENHEMPLAPPVQKYAVNCF